MQNRNLWIGVVAVAVLVVGWYLFRPERLFVNQTVSESLAVAETAPTSPMSASTEPGTMVADDMMDGAAQVLRRGMFHDGSHHTTGTATVYRLGDGKRVLRFTGFETSNGPDVQVYLVAADDAKDNETVTQAGFVHLAALKGNQGDQNYELPADLDLEKYRAVTIWCRRFGVNFGTAPLTAHS